MIPGRFEYAVPTDPAGCVDQLGDGARILAGGTWVLPEMGRAESRPTRLVDLRRAGLDTISVENGRLHVGAMVTYSSLLASEAAARHAPLLTIMADGITGGWALRNQATLGGSVASARPQSDVPGALAVSDATVHILGPGGGRTSSVADLLIGAMRTSLRPRELITGFTLPSWAGWGAGYVKLKRGHSSWPIATAGALVRLDERDRCTDVRLTLGGVAAVPVSVDLSAVMLGRAPDAVTLAEAAEIASAAVRDPWGDVLAPAGYRAAVAAPIARRALSMAFDDSRTTRKVSSHDEHR